MDVGLGSYSPVPTPTSHQVRAGIPGREPALDSGNCLSGEAGASSRVCLYPGKAGCWVMGQSVYRENARTASRHRGTFVQGEAYCLGYDSPCTGGGRKCWKVCPGLTQQFFHDLRAVEAIGPQALQVPWVPQG